MASGPNWNPRRGTWYVQYWDGKWRRKTVMKKPRGWKVGDPAPSEPPPKALAASIRLRSLEAVARERDEKGKSSEFDNDGIISNLEAFRNVLWPLLDMFFLWSQLNGFERIDQLTPKVVALWLKDQSKGEIEDEIDEE